MGNQKDKGQRQGEVHETRVLDLVIQVLVGKLFAVDRLASPEKATRHETRPQATRYGHRHCQARSIALATWRHDTPAVTAGEVTALTHEAFDDAVKLRALVVQGLSELAHPLFARAERAEIFGSPGDLGVAKHRNSLPQESPSVCTEAKTARTEQ